MKKNNYIRIIFFAFICSFLNSNYSMGMKYDMLAYAADYYVYTDFTETDVYNTLISFKSKYPEGMYFTNDRKYTWKGGIYKTGGGCAAFAFELSDAVFGNLPARMAVLDEYNSSNILPGDILRVENDTHSYIVLEVKSNHVVVAEANFNLSVHWGREVTYEKLNDGSTSYIMTRYPDAISPIKSVPVEDIKLEYADDTIYVGDTLAIKPTLLPKNNTNPTWSVAYTKYYTALDFYDGYVFVKALNAGETVIKVNADDGSGTSAILYITILERDENAPSVPSVIYPKGASESKATEKVSSVKISSVKNTSNGIKLDWTKNTDATGYYIYRSVGDGSFTKIKTIKNSTITSYLDKDAKTNGKMYRYKLVAFKTTNSGTYNAKASSVKTYYFVADTQIKKLTNKNTKKLYVTYSKNNKATGYQIEYAKNKKFTSSKKLTIKNNKTVSKTIGKLTKNQTYYVRVRSFKKVSGKNYYSAWSKTKKLKITK